MSRRGDIDGRQAAPQPQLDLADPVAPAPTEGQTQGRIQAKSKTQPAGTSPASVPPSGESELVEKLVATGVSPTVAQELFTSFPQEQITLQLDCLSDREPKNPPATLVTAIRQGWSPPAPYTDRFEAQEREQSKRAAVEAQRRSRSAQQAVEQRAAGGSDQCRESSSGPIEAAPSGAGSPLRVRC